MANTFGNYPAKYLLFNQALSKNLGLVFKIDGIPTLFGISDTFTQIRYGDAGLIYGLPGIVYGGLRKVGSIKPYMQLDSGLTIQQRIEPEQGKGNVGNITISLVDYNGEVSKMLSPGIIVPEILAGRLCTLYLGFTETSFPEDYVILYRGFVTQAIFPQGLVKLQISDCTAKKRSPIFNLGTTLLNTPLPADSSPVTVDLISTSQLHKHITSPDGFYDPNIQTYFVIDSEVFQYGPTDIISGTQVNATRGAQGTAFASHSVGASVSPSIGFGFNPEGVNAIELALKLLLSGWDGPSETNIPILSFVYDYKGNFVSNEFVLETDDASLDLGLTVGDAFYISDSASGNSVSGFITGFQTGFNGQTTIIQTDKTFTIENPTNAVAAFRSQYDTFPITSGIGCTMAEVDVETFQQIRNSFFVSLATSNLRVYYDAPEVGKDLIDRDINLPLGCYGISRFGRISMAITKPPLPGAGSKLVQIDWKNVLDPEKILVTRATNQRSFYNQISYEYDYNVSTQTFTSIQYFLDTTSASQFNDVEVLPISAKGVSSQLGGALIAQSRGGALLSRFKNCLTWIELTVNWSVGSLIEVSDIVLLVDDGHLKIMNFDTGERNLGSQLFEVIDRNYQIVSGNVKLKLLGGLGFGTTSRFGLYSPSSILNSGCTTTKLRVTPSFGQTTVPNEIAKWTPLIGQGVMVHDPSWSVTGQCVIIRTDPGDSSALLIQPPLLFTPSSGYVLDIAPYPVNQNPSTDSLLKSLYAHFTPTIPITSGVSETQFNLPASGVSLLTVGNSVILRNGDYSTRTNDLVVESVSGTLVTVSPSVGFVPTTDFVVEGIGYHDGGGYYRYT